MSKEDYAKLLIHAPARLVVVLALAVGGGAGWQFVYNDGDVIRAAQREVDACLVQLAKERSIAHQYERDIEALNEWATKSISSLTELQRLDALGRAPAAYSSAVGLGVSQ